MSDMQAFRDRLIEIDEETDPLLESLSQLTEATTTQLWALWTVPGWSNWNAEDPEPSSCPLP